MSNITSVCVCINGETGPKNVMFFCIPKRTYSSIYALSWLLKQWSKRGIFTKICNKCYKYTIHIILYHIHLKLILNNCNLIIAFDKTMKYFTFIGNIESLNLDKKRTLLTIGKFKNGWRVAWWKFYNSNTLHS